MRSGSRSRASFRRSAAGSRSKPPSAKPNSRLKHIEFVRLEPERALVVLVSEDGQVENRVLTLPPGVPSSALVEATNFLNSRIRGRTLAEARLELETALTQN